MRKIANSPSSANLRASKGQLRSSRLKFSSRVKFAATPSARNIAQVQSQHNYGGFDPFLLVRRLPSAMRGSISVREGGMKILSSNLGFEKYWAELRGVMLVFFEEEAQQWEAGDSDPYILGISCVVGTTLSREKKEIKLKRGKGDKLLLKFNTDAECDKWEAALDKVSKQRTVGLSDFEYLAPIGRGASGKVFLVKDKVTKQILALKSIEKKKVYESRSNYRHMVDERLAMEVVHNHPFFVQLRYAFQTSENFYLILEFYQGGDMFQYMKNHNGKLSEESARHVMAEVVLALEFFHQRNFIFRDLKPENVLLDSKGHIRIADFGLCKRLEKGPNDAMTSTVCGTFTYAAPEMLAVKKYGTSIDVWALGIFCYHILRGRTPFEANDLEQVMYKMKHQPLRFPNSTPEETVQFITGLLDSKPESRLGCSDGGVSDLKKHQFFKDINWEDAYYGRNRPFPLFTEEEMQSKDVLSNFDLEEWAHVSIDEDYDDMNYSDLSLWPIMLTKKHEVEDMFMIAFTFSSS